VDAVHATLTGLPLRGATHGLLRYLGTAAGIGRALAQRPRPEMLFNYLGLTDGHRRSDSRTRVTDEPHGRRRSPNSPRAYVLEINARVEDGQLMLALEYSRRLHRPQSIAALADGLRESLVGISAIASPRFGLARLDERGLAVVADLLSELDSD
jgi:tyrocidine synthetase-2